MNTLLAVTCLIIPSCHFVHVAMKLEQPDFGKLVALQFIAVGIILCL